MASASHHDIITPDKVSSLPRNKLAGMVNKSTGEKGSIPNAAKRSTSGINQISQLLQKSSAKKADTSSKKKPQVMIRAADATSTSTNGQQQRTSRSTESGQHNLTTTIKSASAQ